METPSSIGRRSHTEKKNAQEEALSRSTNSGNHDRAALQDISNDSPIIGVTIEKTPLSSMIKQGLLPKRTPCSGEALLRGQVKILLEKVEEDAEFVNKLSSNHCGAFLHSQGLLAAPTPYNTPQIFSLSRAKEEDTLIALPKIAESTQHEEHLECVINRALLFDSPSKSEASDFSSISSSVTNDGSVDSSCYDENWSTQVNASCYKGVEEDEFKEEGGEEEEGYMDELCDGFENITIEEKGAKLFQFKGKRTRFVYNSDDEFEGEEEIGKALPLSPSVLLLKGLPVPEGKHLRFNEDE